jgi:hypothetical protein
MNIPLPTTWVKADSVRDQYVEALHPPGFWWRAPWGARKRAIRVQARNLGHTLGRFDRRRSCGPGYVAEAVCSGCGRTAMTWSVGDSCPYGGSIGICEYICEGGAK